MTLESLVLGKYRNYSACKIDGEMVVNPNPKGKYRARDPRFVQDVLNMGKSTDIVYVRTRIGGKWSPMRKGGS